MHSDQDMRKTRTVQLQMPPARQIDEFADQIEGCCPTFQLYDHQFRTITGQRRQNIIRHLAGLENIQKRFYIATIIILILFALFIVFLQFVRYEIAFPVGFSCIMVCILIYAGWMVYLKVERFQIKMQIASEIVPPI